MPDAECVKIVSEILHALDLHDFTIKVRRAHVYITCVLPCSLLEAVSYWSDHDARALRRHARSRVCVPELPPYAFSRSFGGFTCR
jgi:hypothetical protein